MAYPYRHVQLMNQRMILTTLALATALALALATTGCGGGSAARGRGGDAGSGGTTIAPGGAPGTTPLTVPDVTLLEAFPRTVSADGAVVAGDTTLWTAATGAVSVGRVQALSADGSTVVGSLDPAGGSLVQIVGGTVTPIDLPGPSFSQSSAIGVSRDGTTVAGNACCTGSNNPAAYSTEAFRWTAVGGVQELAFLPGDDASAAFAMSPDGSTIVGASYNTAQRTARPFLWTSTRGLTELPTLAGSSLTLPTAVNDAGTVVGDSYTGGEVSFSSISGAASRDPVIWSQDGLRVIGGCPPGAGSSATIAADGTVLGTCNYASLFVASPRADGEILTMPQLPPAFDNDVLTVSPVGLSGDATVVVGGFSGEYGERGLIVWTRGVAQPTLFAMSLRGMPGSVDLENPVPTALSEDGSTVVGGAAALVGWLLRLR